MPRKRLHAAGVEQKLREYHGNFAAVARAFSVTRQSVQKFIATRPKLSEVALECREAMKDDAESALYKAVHEGQAWAICFFLKTQAKDRNYVERQEFRGVHDEELDRVIEQELERLVAIRQEQIAFENPPELLPMSSSVLHNHDG